MNARPSVQAAGGRRPGRSRHRGFSLVEILVVVVLFSIGLLGMVGLQAKAVQFSVNAEDSSRAALLAGDLASTMWAERTVNLAEDRIEAWQDRVADPQGDGLPDGLGEVLVDGNVATVTIRWRPPGSRPDEQHRYTTQVVIP